MFEFSNVRKVKISNHIGIVVNTEFNCNTEEDEKCLRDVFDIAQEKYQRMHCDNPSMRFDKSWTGC